VLIYCISQLIATMNDGRPISKTLHLRARDLLIATNRDTTGSGYKLLRDAFERLQGTQMVNRHRRERDVRLFSLIDVAAMLVAFGAAPGYRDATFTFDVRRAGRERDASPVSKHRSILRVHRLAWNRGHTHRRAAGRAARALDRLMAHKGFAPPVASTHARRMFRLHPIVPAPILSVPQTQKVSSESPMFQAFDQAHARRSRSTAASTSQFPAG